MKRYLLIMIMIIYTACTEAQIRSLQNYAVITFEQAVKKEKQSFYWIIPIDSLNSIKTLPTKIPLYPLYLDDCSEANYHRCIEGNMISYLDNYASSSENYEKFIMNVMDIVISHRKLLETIEICWENRSDKKLYLEELKEKKRIISIYCTPLSGEFACCPICEDKNMGGDYFSNVFIPVKNISYNPDFWETNHPELLSRTNFMYLDYSSYVMRTARKADDISKPKLGR